MDPFAEMINRDEINKKTDRIIELLESINKTLGYVFDALCEEININTKEERSGIFNSSS